MVLTKELILSVLERNSKQFKINGFTLTILDKVDWGKAAKEILEVQNFSSEEQPQLNKHDVSGWQDFATHPPKVGDEVILKNKMTERKVILRLQHYQLDFDGLKDNWWMPSPA